MNVTSACAVLTTVFAIAVLSTLPRQVQGADAAVSRCQTVQFEVTGDDALSVKFQDALMDAFHSARDFECPKRDAAYELRIVLPSNLRWSRSSRGLTFYPVVIVIDKKGRYLGAITDECWEDQMRECANAALEYTRMLVRERLTTRSSGP